MTNDRSLFIEDIDYKEVSPIEGKRKWRWKTLIPTRLEFDYCVAPYQLIEFYDQHHKKWLTISGRYGMVEPGYYWNGNTPKVHVPIFGWIGTPDNKKTRKASLWHDILCQMALTEHIPFDKSQIDAVFYDILKIEKYKLASIFHGAVRKLGPLFEEERKEYSTLKLIKHESYFNPTINASVVI